MHPTLFAALAVTKPLVIGVGLAALVVLYLAFKTIKFAMKLLLLAVLTALGLAAWWYFATPHASF